MCHSVSVSLSGAAFHTDYVVKVLSRSGVHLGAGCPRWLSVRPSVAVAAASGATQIAARQRA
jgi:hypothetical protein